MAIGVTTRKYALARHPPRRHRDARSANQCAPSLGFLGLTTEMLSEWMASPLGDLDMWAVFMD